MTNKLEDMISAALRPEKKGEGKLMPLSHAVRGFVKPGMKVHLAAGIGGPSAAICEIIRQYRGKTPDFTVIQSSVTGHALNLVHCNLVKRLVCAVCADISASARPSKIVQKAYENKHIELENWSLYSLQQRLMAGAHGFPFITTRSVVGSSIASDNSESFREMEDPFGSGAKIGLVKALNPDISIVHGCVGDLEGNIILNAPYGEDLWGSFASIGGVIATVEKIVPTEYIRQYAALVKIPGSMVNAICVAPMGLHPFSLPNPGISDFDPYDKDVDFLNGLHNASGSAETLDRWIEEWIIGCVDHEGYLRKVGSQRIDALKAKAKSVKGLTFPDRASVTDIKKEYDPKEMMLIVLAREVTKSIREHRHRMVLAGAGAGSTAAFMAYYVLRSEGYEIELVTGNGQIGYSPIPGESILSSEAGVRTSKMLADTIMTQGILVGGKNNRCLSVLGAGQMDKYGNINSTVTSKGQFLVGSGGANDAMNAREVIISLDQSKERYVEKLPYITGTGGAVSAVISTMGVFKKTGPQDELRLAACFPGPQEASLDEKVKEIQDRCGWTLKIAQPVEEIPEPTQDELDLLHWLLASS